MRSRGGPRIATTTIVVTIATTTIVVTIAAAATLRGILGARRGGRGRGGPEAEEAGDVVRARAEVENKPAGTVGLSVGGCAGGVDNGVRDNEPRGDGVAEGGRERCG